MNTAIPDDDELDRIALASMPVVLERIRIRPRRRRVHAIAIGAGIALLAGGAVAATALVPDPGNGVEHMGQPSVFALDCYATDGSQQVSNVYAKDAQIDRASTDPTGTCVEQEQDSAIQDVVSATATEQYADGVRCGVVIVRGTAGASHRWSWLPDAQGSGVSTTNGNGSWDDPRWTTACARDVTTITSPPAPPADQVACMKAANWVRVYVASGRTAAAVCAAAGLTPWGN